MLTSPNPGLEAASDYFSLFRCGPALQLRVLWVDSSRDAAALVLGYTYLLNFRASLLGASWGGDWVKKIVQLLRRCCWWGRGNIYIYIYTA